jgi:hypothetical protein
MDTFIDSLVESKPRPVRRSRVLRCTNCGRENGRQRTYCTRCGTVLRKAKKPKAAGGAVIRPRRHGFDYMLAAVLMLLVAVAYLVYASRAARTPTTEHAQGGPAIPSMAPATKIEPPEHRSNEGWPADDPAPVAVRVEPPALAEQNVPMAPRAARRANVNPTQRAAANVPPVPAVAEPAAPPALEARQAPPVVAEAPRPTPQQQLQSALDQCGGDFLTRFVCEQRTRLNHCDGHWGQWAQCPGMPSADRVPGG